MTVRAKQTQHWYILRLLLSLVLVGVSSYLIVTTVMSFFSVREVSLPDVSGLSIEEATVTLESLGFKVKTYDQIVSGVPVNSVTAQSPEAGAVVRQGRSISLGVNSSGEIEVPLLINSTQEQAKTILNALGLELGEVSYTYSDIPQGKVISQTPEQTTRVSRNTKVSTVVSRGPNVPTVTLPSVLGLGIDDAKQRLSRLGFTVDTVPSSISSDRPQTVTQQTPPAGESVPTSTRITLGYSLSSSIVVQVPNLVGNTLENAQALLQAAGLTLGPVSYVTADPAKPGGITTYSPSRYTVRGAPVLVEYNGYEPIPSPTAPTLAPTTASPSPTPGPATPAPEVQTTPVPEVTPNTPVTPTPTASSDGSRDLPFSFDPGVIGISALIEKSYNLRLEVQDDRGQRELFSRTMAAGEPLTATYKVYGPAQLQIYINDILYQAYSDP